MNEVLNNIFDEESMQAIRNANSICPSPETFQTKHDVEYKEVTTDSDVEVPEVVDNSIMESLMRENKELRLRFDTQKEIISKIVASQNEMIKEINQLQEKLANVNSLPKPEPVKKEEHKEQEEKQQTGAGEGLDPKDYSVEDIFYFGNKN